MYANQKKENDVQVLIKLFAEDLKANKKKLSLLQLVGKLEEYVVKELAFFLYCHYDFQKLPLINIGNRGQHKIDLVLISGNIDDQILKIELAIEAKYFRNTHRFYYLNSAEDEIPGEIKKLISQTDPLTPGTHSYFEVPKSMEIHGLVIGSFVSDSNNDPGRDVFFQRTLGRAGMDKFHKSRFIPVYEDVRVVAGDCERFATLRLCPLRRNEKR